MATDGEIDFRTYTREQLDSVVSRMDHERYPINSRNLISEYQRRKAEEQAAAALAAASGTPQAPDRRLNAPKTFQVKFQPSTFFADWLEPSRNDFHLTGSGTVQVGDAVVTLKGRRASYMAGIPLRRTEELGRRYIANVEVQDCVLRFELRVPGQKVRHLALWLKSPEESLELSRMLPPGRTPDFVPRLHERVEFERLLIAQSPRTPVTWTLIGLCILVYAATALISGEWLDLDGASLISMGSDYGPYTTDGDWFRLFTSMFLHGGLLHILFNMWALASFGPMVERLFGSISYATIYLVAGIASSLTSVSWNPDVNSIGASGAIFGLLGALAAIQVHHDGSIPISILKPLRRSSLIYIGVALLAGFESNAIDNAAHVGGLLAGYLLGYTLRRPVTGLRPDAGAFVRRLSVAAIVSLFLIGTGVFVAKQATTRLTNEGQYNATVHWFGPREVKALNRWRELGGLVKAEKWDGPTYASRIESDIEPFWNEAQARFAKIELPDTSNAFDSLQYLQDITEDRSHAYGLIAQGLRKDDGKLTETGVAELEQVDKRITERNKAK